MTTKIAVGLALLLALAGWGLKNQISANGELQEQIRKVEADLKAERGRVEMMRLEIEERDLAVEQLQVRYDELRERKAKIRTVVRKVYVHPGVEEWAQTVPPAPVVRTLNACIDRLWDTGAEGDHPDCSDLPAGGNDG